MCQSLPVRRNNLSQPIAFVALYIIAENIWTEETKTSKCLLRSNTSFKAGINEAHVPTERITRVQVKNKDAISNNKYLGAGKEAKTKSLPSRNYVAVSWLRYICRFTINNRV